MSQTVITSPVGPIKALSNETDGSGAIAYTFDTLSPLTIAGALHTSINNNGSRIFSVDKDGNVFIAGGLLVGGGIASVIDIYNVKYYGAIGNGIHDDAPAINACIAAVSALGGGTAYAPPGTYLLGTTSTDPDSIYSYIVPKDNVNIVGAGIDSTFFKVKNGENLRFRGTNGPFIVATQSAAPLQNVWISGITFDWNGANNLLIQEGTGSPVETRRNNASIFSLNGGIDILIERCKIKETPGNQCIFFPATVNQGQRNIVVRECIFKDSGSGLTGNYNSDHSSIYCNAEGVAYINNRFEAANQVKGACFEIHGSHSFATLNHGDSYERGFWLASDFEAIKNITVEDNHFTNVDFAFSPASFAGLYAINNINILDNTFEQRAGATYSGTNWFVGGNTLAGCSLFRMEGNEFLGTSAANLRFMQLYKTDHFFFTNNKVSNFVGYGIQGAGVDIGSGKFAKSVLVEGNTFIDVVQPVYFNDSLSVDSFIVTGNSFQRSISDANACIRLTASASAGFVSNNQIDVNYTTAFAGTPNGVVYYTPGSVPSPSTVALGGVFSYAAVTHQFLTQIGTDGSISSAQPAFTDISGSVASSQLPNPGASSLGGVRSYAAVTNQFLTQISTSGVVSSAQPAFTDISGTVAATQLPNPSATTLGGVKSLASVSHNFLTSISTSGVPTQAQPAFTDISGTVAAAQLPNPGASSLGGVQSYAAVSNQFLTQISTSGVVTSAQPAFTDISGSVAASQMPALTGDVTTSAGAVATTIAANAVTNAKAAQMAANTIKGNNTGSTANATDMTVSQLNTLTGNSGDVTIGAFGSTPSSTGFSISAQVITGQPADGTHPGMLSTTTQTIAGNKTFSGTIDASNIASVASASTIMLRDVNANTRINNVIENFVTTATAAGTLTLTVSSAAVQQLTGTTTHNVVLPDATTLVIGQAFIIINRSTGIVTVKDGGSTTVLAVPAGATIVFTVTAIGSTAGTWDAGGLWSPTASTLGGVKSLASASHQFLTQIGTDGSVSQAQPAFTDISGTASAAQLPNPGVSSLGGVQSYASVSHQFLTQISTSGVVSSAQPAFTDISGSVAASQLPNPSSSTLGGVQSAASVSHQWINSISTSGVPALSQPAFTDISGSVAASQLPNPSSSTLGGVQSAAAVTHQWINSISTSGVPALSQPAFTDISGSVAASQLPNPSSSTLGGVQSAAAVSHQWINSISTSGVPALSQPAFTDISGTATDAQLPTTFSTNKTVSANLVWHAAWPTQVNLTWGSTVTVDGSLGSQFVLTATDTTTVPTISTATNPQSRQRFEFRIVNSSGGTMQQPVWNADWTFIDGPPLMPTNGNQLVLEFEHNGSGTYLFRWCGRLPRPSTTTLGGVNSFAAVTSQWIRQIGTDGAITASQPAFTDVSGTATAAQLPVAAASTSGIVNASAQSLDGQKTFLVPMIEPRTLVQPTNGGSVQPDMSVNRFYDIRANAGVSSFTINTPLWNGSTGGTTNSAQELTIQVYNNSGGALTVTWDTTGSSLSLGYAFIGGSAPTNPANGKSRNIMFRYFGATSKFNEQWKSSGDI